MNNTDILARLTECGIPCDELLAARIARYHELLLDWNTRMDLTAVTDEAEMLDRHYVDSLMPLREGITFSGSLIDVGTGAGFPGLPLAMACPDLSVTLMDAQQKRLTFLQAVIDDLQLTNVTLVHARAEDGGHNSAWRGKFDWAVARAVAPLPVLCEYLLPFVKTGGHALCWKGPALDDELTAGRRAAHLLEAKLRDPIRLVIPGRDWDHRLLMMDKTGGTPQKYPRKAGTPSKAPLGV
ncbi:MAG: 16S rRNA (guanine(527)-N(7))-methyltransferase RsmG [Clostridia bacterium]|nr:16S rRNA (guanine(527)-N(7))-methyltransferase RsmG [Clostridia bacterium]